MMAYVDRKQRVNAVLERTIGYQLSRPLADRAWRVPPPKLLNSVLVRVTGYQLSRPLAGRAWNLPKADGGRLLTAPIFVFSAPRAGSTLLRAILGSHSQLYGPPELPLRHLGVRAETKWIRASLEGLDLTVEDVEHMLWDRVLYEALRRSGKPRLVVKTPANVLVWERIAATWPDAKFIFLLRHPAAAVASLHSSFDPAWHAADPFFGGQKVGELYAAICTGNTGAPHFSASRTKPFDHAASRTPCGPMRDTSPAGKIMMAWSSSSARYAARMRPRDAASPPNTFTGNSRLDSGNCVSVFPSSSASRSFTRSSTPS